MLKGLPEKEEEKEGGGGGIRRMEGKKQRKILKNKMAIIGQQYS